MAAQGLQERQLAFLSPAGHGLGRDMEDVGGLGGPEVAGRGGCGLAAGLGCHGASLRAADAGSSAGAGVDRLFGRHRRCRPVAPTVPRWRAWRWTDRTIIDTRPSTPPLPAWVVSAPSYLMRQTPIAARTPPRPQSHHAQADQLEDAEVRRSPSLFRPARTAEAHTPIPATGSDLSSCSSVGPATGCGDRGPGRPALAPGRP